MSLVSTSDVMDAVLEGGAPSVDASEPGASVQFSPSSPAAATADTLPRRKRPRRFFKKISKFTRRLTSKSTKRFATKAKTLQDIEGVAPSQADLVRLVKLTLCA